MTVNRAATALLLLVAATATTAAAQNLVRNGDFEGGNFGFHTGYIAGNVSGPATYFIGNNPASAPGAYPDWCNCGDHTSGNGNMMIVNGANSATTAVWQESVAVKPNSEYVFSFWAAEVDHESNSLPQLAVRLNGKLAGTSTVPRLSPDNGGAWKDARFAWNSGPNRQVTMAIYDLNTETAWNDFALDDISLVGSVAKKTSSDFEKAAGIVGNAVIKAGYTNGAAINFKPQEKVAFTFMESISNLEQQCDSRLNRLCSLAELLRGVKRASGMGVWHLKYDPAEDTNYTYKVVVKDNEWVATATPNSSGLGGFRYDGGMGPPERYFNPDGPATNNAAQQIGSSGEMELFNIY